MSQTLQMSPRDLWWGLFKIAALLAFGLVFAAFIVTILIAADDSPFPIIGLTALALAIAFHVLASGFLAILKILDWFEDRRVKSGAKHG